MLFRTAKLAENLSHDEAIKAVRISTIELNGFADFLSKLETVHPNAVEEVFICVKHMLKLTASRESRKAPMFHDALYHGSLLIKNSSINAIMDKLDTIGSVMEKGSHSDLKYIFELIAAHGSEASKAACAKLVDSHLNANLAATDERNSWVALLASLTWKKACEKGHVVHQ